MSTQLATYKAADILGRSQLDLVLRVYDGAIKGLTDARQNFSGNDAETGRKNIELTRNCVTHLYTTLDFEKGGQIAEKLAELYVFVLNKLSEIESTKDTASLDSVVRILNNLRAGWLELKEQGATSPEMNFQSTGTSQALTPEHPITV
jgi:flagellar protein FliS